MMFPTSFSRDFIDFFSRFLSLSTELSAWVTARLYSSITAGSLSLSNRISASNRRTYFSRQFRLISRLEQPIPPLRERTLQR